jgi:hypothetical protein
MIYLASAYPTPTRLAIALAGLALFGVAATTRWPAHVPAVAIAVLCVLIGAWLFGATLVWGTGYATKVRWSAAWTYNGYAWQWTALLAVALLGALSLGMSARCFAHDRHTRAWTWAALAGATFLGWTTVVRYSPVVAVIAAAASFTALRFIATATSASAPAPDSVDRNRPPSELAVPLLLATIVVGIAWGMFAFGWLLVGPEGRPSCNCWADQWNDWQYQVQFLTALIGALSAALTAVCYVMGRKRLVVIPGICAISAAGVWLTFLATA